MVEIDLARLDRCCSAAIERLLAERTPAGHWVGELSTSPLSTAVSVVALHLVDRDRHAGLVRGGIEFLARTQNADGGWGDTLKSFSNIATSMLAVAAFNATGAAEQHLALLQRAARYIDSKGGLPGLRKRYGKDQTFQVPILTCSALAGVTPWNAVPRLPFELACLPPSFYKTVRLPVVSYALPALIAIGQVRHFHGKPWNPLMRWIRDAVRDASLRRLITLQPPNGGFLEASPLTAFVTMSLAGMGMADHVVAARGAEFLRNSVRPDGSWPIDTNLATWVTTLAVNALEEDLPADGTNQLIEWLLNQQYREVHPFTQAAPGGWAWTNLPGGVPDADDTPGAILALSGLRQYVTPEQSQRIDDGIAAAVKWLVDLQNRDGGWPTFCRGWGALPFDRSSADITAHALRALNAGEWRSEPRVAAALAKGRAYLARCVRTDGSILPLWFGNQHLPEEENPTYGSAKSLAAICEYTAPSDLQNHPTVRWLDAAQDKDGGWGAGAGTPSTVEETSLAVHALCLVACRTGAPSPALAGGVNWLCDRVESGTIDESSPIGFYFAKLWYYERLYPLVYAVDALRSARKIVRR